MRIEFIEPVNLEIRLSEESGLYQVIDWDNNGTVWEEFQTLNEAKCFVNSILNPEEI